VPIGACRRCAWSSRRVCGRAVGIRPRRGRRVRGRPRTPATRARGDGRGGRRGSWEGEGEEPAPGVVHEAAPPVSTAVHPREAQASVKRRWRGSPSDEGAPILWAAAPAPSGLTTARPSRPVPESRGREARAAADDAPGPSRNARPAGWAPGSEVAACPRLDARHRIAQRHGIGELVAPLAGQGLGFLLQDVPASGADGAARRGRRRATVDGSGGSSPPVPR